jgi:hypothetical protein
VTDESTEVMPHGGADTIWTHRPRDAPREADRVSPRLRRASSSLHVPGPILIAASAFESLHGLLHSTGFEVARNLALFLAVVFWLGLANWVYRDARRRIDDLLLVGTASALGISVPFVGPVLYLLFRPPETLDECRAREIDIRALEERLGQRAPRCPACRGETEEGFLVCPVCTTRLKQPCAQCSAPLEPSWKVCPYCATSPVAAGRRLVEPDLDEALTAEIATAKNGGGTRDRPARAHTTSQEAS